MSEKDYWYKAIDKPGLLLLAGTARMSEFLDEDVKTKRPTGPGENTDRPHKQHRTGGEIVPYVPTPPVPTGGTPRSGKGRGGGKGEDHSVWDGSKYLKNRAGASLCRGYQTGVCLRQNSYNLCAQDGCSAHQCDICLMVGHGSSEVAKCPRQGGAGRGRGGRGGGRGGGGRGRGGQGRGRGNNNW